MKNISNKVKIIILTIFLVVVSTLFIIINGNTYTIKYDNLNNNIEIEKLNIFIEDEDIINCIDKDIEKGVLKVKIASKSK